MSNLFKKAAVFTDLHIGLKSNSQLHNEDCLNFVKWFTTVAQREECDTVIMTGDWHNNRASINIVSLNYSLQCMEILSNNFSKIFFIPGNHDLYYRDKREINSVVWAKHLPNIRIINDFYTGGGVTFCPWLVGDEHKKLKKISSRYVFGHFELPKFYMNSKVQMPDIGEIKAEHFQEAGTVISGHFHKRQQQGNIHYIGNAFPHNYADAWDDDRGCAIIEWDKDPVYFSWPDAPRFRTFKLSDLLDDPGSMLFPNSYARVDLDVDISYEEANFIKETFVNTYNMREISLIPVKNDSYSIDLAPGEISFQSVDQIVASQISEIASEFYDPALLLDIYRNL